MYLYPFIYNRNISKFVSDNQMIEKDVSLFGTVGILILNDWIGNHSLQISFRLRILKSMWIGTILFFLHNVK